MAVTSNLSYSMSFAGDVAAKDIYSITENAASPGQIEIQDLGSGDNTITVPSGGSSTCQVCIIQPPAANATTITLKGNTGDTGVSLGLTDPTSLALNSVSSFILTTGGAITGVRFTFV